MRQKGLIRGTRNYPTISGHLLAGATLLKTQGEAPPTHEYVWDIDKLVDIMPDLTLEAFDEDGEKILPTQQELISSFEYSSRKATVQEDFHTIPLSEIERSEEHTSELQSLMRSSYAVFCLKQKSKHITHHSTRPQHI